MQQSPTKTAAEPACVLGAERALKTPLGALRVLLEGARQGTGSTPTIPFIERALACLGRVEHAAEDLVAWSAPRSVRTSAATVGEIADSVAAVLDPVARRRCHFVIDDADARLHTDARLLVETFSRSIRARFERTGDPSELMVHAHADGNWATFSFIDAPSDADGEAELELDTPSAPCLADQLLERDVARLGGRVSVHETGGHRCCVAVVPTSFGEDAA